MGFCPSGVLSQWGFVPVGFCPSGVLSQWGFVLHSLTLYINFSGAQYDKIAVDVDKSSIIYKTDIHVHDN